MAKRKFNVGDTVYYTRKDSIVVDYNSRGTVIEIDPYRSPQIYSVRFGRFYQWWCSARDLASPHELRVPPKQFTFKVTPPVFDNIDAAIAGAEQFAKAIGAPVEVIHA